MKLNTVIWSAIGLWGIRIDVTRGAVLFYVLFIAILMVPNGLSFQALAVPLMFALAVLGHEWGHAWGARRQGLKVERIALTFGGGVCETDGGDVNRVFWMVLAGPMASLAISISSFAASVVFVVYLTLQGFDASMIAENPQLWMWLVIFGLINLAFAVFNLFPFQPLDGGRLVHLGLSRFLHPDRARLIAGCVGLAFGVIWVPFMIWMLTLGLFIPVLPNLQTHWRMIFGRDAGPAVLDIKPILGPVQLLRPLP